MKTSPDPAAGSCLSAPVPYLWAAAERTRTFRSEWPAKYRRFFQIAGITVRLESDLDLGTVTFPPALAAFAVEGPGDDNVTLRHHFELPDLAGKDLGKEVYRKAPWVISRKGDTWLYRNIWPVGNEPMFHFVAAFNAAHTYAKICSPSRCQDAVRTSGWHSLSLFPTDQVWLAPLLADRSAALLHSASVVLDGRGLLFVGHSGAGKSTIVTLLKGRAKILSDDRNIVRRWPDGWHMHGTWSHGDVPDVSPSAAPLRAILFLEQDKRNTVIRLTDRKEVWKRLLATLIKPFTTAEWWQKELDVLEQVVREVPCYTIHFDKSDAIVDHLAGL